MQPILNFIQLEFIFCWIEFIEPFSKHYLIDNPEWKDFWDFCKQAKNGMCKKLSFPKLWSVKKQD